MLAVKTLLSRPTAQKLQTCFRYQSPLRPGALINVHSFKMLPSTIQNSQSSMRLISETTLRLKDDSLPPASSAHVNAEKLVELELPGNPDTVKFDVGATKKPKEEKVAKRKLEVAQRDALKEDLEVLGYHILGGNIKGNERKNMMDQERSTENRLALEEKFIESKDKQQVIRLSEQGMKTKVQERKVKKKKKQSGTTVNEPSIASIVEAGIPRVKLKAFKKSHPQEQMHLLKSGIDSSSDANTPKKRTSSPPKPFQAAARIAVLQEELKRHAESDIKAYRGGFATADTWKFEKSILREKKNRARLSDGFDSAGDGNPDSIGTTIAELQSNIAEKATEWELKKKDYLEEFQKKELELKEATEIKRVEDKISERMAKRVMWDSKAGKGHSMLWEPSVKSLKLEERREERREAKRKMKEEKKKRVKEEKKGVKKQKMRVKKEKKRLKEEEKMIEEGKFKEAINSPRKVPNATPEEGREPVEKTDHAYGLGGIEIGQREVVMENRPQRDNEETDVAHKRTVEQNDCRGKEAKGGAIDKPPTFYKTSRKKVAVHDALRKDRNNEPGWLPLRNQPLIVADDWVTDQESDSRPLEAHNTPLDSFLLLGTSPSAFAALDVPPWHRDSSQSYTALAPVRVDADEPQRKDRNKGKSVKGKNSQNDTP